jgi:transposase-like protein
MERRKFTRELKLEAVKLSQERVVTVAQDARDFGVPGTALPDGCRSLSPMRSRPFRARGR